MAQSGYSLVQLYRSSTASATPAAGNLSDGELAINFNTADGKLFYKDSAGAVQVLASKNAAAGTFTTLSASSTVTFSGGTANGVAYLNASKVLTTGTGITYDGTNFLTTGSATATAFIPSAATIPSTGIYLPAANSLGFATNTVARGSIASTGGWTISAPTSGAALTVSAVTGGTTNAGITLNGSGATPIAAVTFSATAMTLDCTRSNVFTTTFTANVTTAPTISNPQDGQTINWFITQDATGTRTMTWPTSFKWPGGTAGVLSTAANSVDLLIAVYRSSTGFWYASLQKAFA